MLHVRCGLRCWLMCPLHSSQWMRTLGDSGDSEGGSCSPCRKPGLSLQPDDWGLVRTWGVRQQTAHSNACPASQREYVHQMKTHFFSFLPNVLSTWRPAVHSKYESPFSYCMDMCSQELAERCLSNWKPHQKAGNLQLSGSVKQWQTVWLPLLKQAVNNLVHFNPWYSIYLSRGHEGKRNRDIWDLPICPPAWNVALTAALPP